MSLDDRDITALPAFRQAVIKTGHENLAEALARRLITPRGGLFYDDDYGYDLRQHINQENTPTLLVTIARNVEDECEKDDRVQSAEADVVQYDLRTYRLGVSCITTEDTVPYAVAISVDPTSVAVSITGPAATQHARIAAYDVAPSPTRQSRTTRRALGRRLG